MFDGTLPAPRPSEPPEGAEPPSDKQESPPMNRKTWNFPYPADKLLEAATAKVDFHKARLAWWTEKKESVLGQIRAEGIEIDESVAAGQGYGKSYARDEQVSIRNDLLRDLNECVAKVREHSEKIGDYDAWMQVLSSQGQSMFDLHQDDWLFFFGRI